VLAYNNIKRDEIRFDRCVASGLQYITICCSVVQCVDVCKPTLPSSVMKSGVASVLQVCCSVLQCAVVCCSVFQHFRKNTMKRDGITFDRCVAGALQL